MWLSDEERKKLKRLEAEMNERKHASRLSRKVTIDFAGRQVIDEPQMTIDIEDDILREIADSMTINASINANMKRSNNSQSDSSVHPLMDYQVPMVGHIF